MSILSVVTDVVKGIGNAIVGTVSVVGGLFADIFSRLIGIPGFILDLIGFRIKKKLRLKFIILMDGATQLIPQDNLEETFKLTKRILKEQANIELIQTGILIAGGAPDGALNVTSPAASFFELWGEVGTYFNGLAGSGITTRRLSVIIVKTMDDDNGRSFGPLANFVLVEKQYFDDPKNQATIVAHEIGHACGLFFHRKQKENLMHKPDDRGEILSRSQSSVIRGSRFVWYL
jgi:hypothetical protein